MFWEFKKRRDHKDCFWAHTYDGDIPSSQGKTKRLLFKSLPKLSIQYILGGKENERPIVLYRIPKANLQKKEYFTKRMCFRKNQVTFVTSIL